MDPSWSVTLTHVAILCALGLAMEVVFTAIVDYPATRDLRPFSSRKHPLDEIVLEQGKFR
jgi:hypothetical protein